MEKKRFDINAFTSGAKKNAASLIDKTKDAVVKTMDKNDDGTFDLKDIGAIAESIGNSAKNAAAAIKESAENKSIENELKQLQPIFEDDIDSADFLMPKLVRIAEIDKRHADSEVCKDSIGYKSTEKDLTIVNIFKGKVDAFGLTFYPDTESDFYYIDPADRDHYIALDEYFNYLKIMRVNELEKIAQDLGAKHFRVVFKERKSNTAKIALKGKLGARGIGNAEAEHDRSSANATSIGIAAESIFPGHEPVQPTLKYLAKDPAVQGLIALRMDKASPSHKSLEIDFSHSSGIKEKDAIKIDAVLKAMKLSGSSTITSEAINEMQRFFEYEIDF